MSDPHNANLKISKHARVRQKQRNITDISVCSAIEYGTKQEWKDATIYMDQNTKVVLSNDHRTVVTVGENTRNTNFVLSERTKQKEETLRYKVNKHNDDYAMCQLAVLYMKGELGEISARKAFKLYSRAAEMGNSHAMCMLSEMYLSGSLGIPNEKLSDMWLKKAADRSNAYALAIIGQTLLLRYLKKYPIESNIFKPSAPKKEILYYLNKAAAKGTTRGVWQLGNIYEKGLLGEKDLSKAIELYVRAAKSGSPSSIKSLYSMTLNCEFSAGEFEDILDYISPTLTHTSIGNAFNLGEEQLFGHLGYNPIRGLNMIEQVAQKQYDEAIRLLAKCYRDGIVCDANLKLAQYWFQKLYELYNISAEEGNVNSLWKLGKLYLQGIVGNIDLEKAESCFNEAVKKSSRPEWLHYLGILYLEGRLVDKPTSMGSKLITQAIKIMQLRVEEGNTQLYHELGVANLSIYSHKNAVYWFSKSDDIECQLSLAEIYLDDSSPVKDILLGLKILENVILNHAINPKVTFHAVNLRINNQTVHWLEEMALHTTRLSDNSSKHMLQEFFITNLASVFEKGKLGEVNYGLASKYYHQLFVDFEMITAGHKLATFYIDEVLPKEYYDAVKNWAVQIPTLLETHKSILGEPILLLYKIYKKGNIIPYDFKEETKWLYLSLYLEYDDLLKEDIKHDFTNLPNISDQKEQIISEIVQLTQKIKINSSLKYKIMSRILGDIFYDNMIVNRRIDEAVHWYTESSLKNNNRASLALAKIYHHDKKDIDTAVKWYMLSTQQGNKSALKELIAIINDEHLENLSTFLKRYRHESEVLESDLLNIKSFKYLEVYPEDGHQMYELGKSYLNTVDKEDNSTLNAAFWFRKAMNRGSFDAGMELFAMYKSGILGSNLIPVADDLHLKLLKFPYDLLNNVALSKKNATPEMQRTILNYICSLLEIDTTGSSKVMKEKVETLIGSPDDISYEQLIELVASLELIQVEIVNILETRNNVPDLFHDNESGSSVETEKKVEPRNNL